MKKVIKLIDVICFIIQLAIVHIAAGIISGVALLAVWTLLTKGCHWQPAY